MFSRSGRQRPTPRQVVDPEAPDDMFPHLPRHRADLVREETMRYLHAEGMDTSWRPDGYIAATATPAAGQATPSPRLIGLDNLSRQVAAAPDAPASEVIDLIHHFLRTVLTDIDVGALDDAEFLRRLHVRLATPDTLEAADAASGALDDATREFTGDLHVSLVLDTPDAVMTMTDDTLATHGTGTREQVADLYRAGYRNTWQELDDAWTDSRVEVTEIRGDTPGARFHAVESDSYFLASAALFLDELLPRWLPGVDASAGVIVAVPHRHLMLVREVSTGKDLLEGINTMSSVALAQLTANPGPLSARLLLAHDGEVRMFTEITNGPNDPDDPDDPDSPDGAPGQRVLQVDPDPYLLSRLEDEN